MNKNSKIYVAGHTGLVGSAIWKTLLHKGYTNLTGRSFEELDLVNQNATAEFFEREKPEYVILAAAKVGGIIANNTYRAEFIYNNLMIQNNIIHQAYMHGVKKLLFLGSTCIYPKEAPQPMKEEYLLTGPLEYTNEPYAIAKIAGIKMCESYNLQYGTNFISVMPTNLYGPNDNFNLETSHVLPALIRKIYLGKCLETDRWDVIRRDLNKRPIERIDGKCSDEDIVSVLQRFGIKKIEDNHRQKDDLLDVRVEIWGSGKPLREFLWSEDMADACIFVMENINFKDLTNGEIEKRNTHINIGTGIEISIIELAELVKTTIGFSGKLEFNTEKPDGTLRKLTDSKMIHQLGWKHEVEINQGIKLLVDCYLNELK